MRLRLLCMLEPPPLPPLSVSLMAEPWLCFMMACLLFGSLMLQQITATVFSVYFTVSSYPNPSVCTRQSHLPGDEIHYNKRRHCNIAEGKNISPQATRFAEVPLSNDFQTGQRTRFRGTVEQRQEENSRRTQVRKWLHLCIISWSYLFVHDDDGGHRTVKAGVGVRDRQVTNGIRGQRKPPNETFFSQPWRTDPQSQWCKRFSEELARELLDQQLREFSFFSEGVLGGWPDWTEEEDETISLLPQKTHFLPPLSDLLRDQWDHPKLPQKKNKNYTHVKAPGETGDYRRRGGYACMALRRKRRGFRRAELMGIQEVDRRLSIAAAVLHNHHLFPLPPSRPPPPLVPPSAHSAAVAAFPFFARTTRSCCRFSSHRFGVKTSDSWYHEPLVRTSPVQPGRTTDIGPVQSR